ncbi:MAG: RIP metalloprotease RseP [Planctomycetes bacterium]|jgi:regulator of sigma E protease|nr:RIP metalloprotease RseP [Planctomycetota bacterium]
MAFGSILLAALGIGLLIFVHELGHFLAARLAGVRVEVFSLGFGPRLWGFEWRGTDFRLAAVPFGGYVMVAGQDPSDHRYPAAECLHSKSIGQRALFWSGGVLMNVLVALVLFPIVFRAGVDFQAPVVGSVTPGSAAWEAGMQHGDRILTIADKTVVSFENLAVEVALAGRKPLPLQIRRGDTTLVVTVLPQFNTNGGRYELGILPPMVDALPRLEVEADSAGARAGLQTGDELLSIDQREPRGAQLHAAVLPVLDPSSAPIAVRVRRDGKELDATLQPLPTAKPTPPRIGIGLLPRKVRGLRQNEPVLERLGLRRGDTVLAIDGRVFLGGQLAVVAAGSGDLQMTVARDGAEVQLRCALTADERQRFAELVVLEAGDGLLLDPTAGLPAAQAGLRAGDRIEFIDDVAIRDFDGLKRAIERAEKPLRFRVARAAADTTTKLFDPERRDLLLEQRFEVTIVPSPQPQFETGIVPQVRELTEEVRAESFGQALAMGGRLSLDLIKQLYVTMKRMVTGDVGAKNLGGIIRISQVSYQAAQRGWTWFLYLMGMLSLNLAFVNLLPIPVLDGGHLLFLLIEKVKGSPVSARVFGYSQMLGLVFVLMLVLFVTYNDIMQLF